MPLSEFDLTGKSYSTSETARIKNLAEEIKMSQEIKPLIVVRDKEGLYILEGGHRAEALYLLGVKYLPAKLVIDLDEVDIGIPDIVEKPDSLTKARWQHKDGTWWQSNPDGGKPIPYAYKKGEGDIHDKVDMQVIDGFNPTDKDNYLEVEEHLSDLYGKTNTESPDYGDRVHSLGAGIRLLGEKSDNDSLVSIGVNINNLSEHIKSGKVKDTSALDDKVFGLYAQAKNVLRGLYLNKGRGVKKSWQHADGSWWKNENGNIVPVKNQQTTRVIGDTRASYRKPVSVEDTTPFGRTSKVNTALSARRSLLQAHTRGAEAKRTLVHSEKLKGTESDRIRRAALSTARVQAWHLADSIDGLERHGLTDGKRLRQALESTYKKLRNYENAGEANADKTTLIIDSLDKTQRAVYNNMVPSKQATSRSVVRSLIAKGKQMPYDVNNPPAKVSKLPKAKQRQFVHVFNSCYEKHGDDAICSKMAWGVVGKDLSDSFVNEFIKDLKGCKNCGGALDKDVVSQLLQFAGRDPRLNVPVPPMSQTQSISEGARPKGGAEAEQMVLITDHELSPEELRDILQSMSSLQEEVSGGDASIEPRNAQVAIKPEDTCECQLCGASFGMGDAKACMNCACPECGAPTSMPRSGMGELLNYLREFNDTVGTINKNDNYILPYGNIYANRDVDEPDFFLNAIINLSDSIKHQLRGCLAKPTFNGVRRTLQSIELFELAMRKSPYKTGNKIVNSAKFKSAKSEIKRMFNAAGGVTCTLPTSEKINGVIEDLEDAVHGVLDVKG